MQFSDTAIDDRMPATASPGPPLYFRSASGFRFPILLPVPNSDSTPLVHLHPPVPDFSDLQPTDSLRDPHPPPLCLAHPHQIPGSVPDLPLLSLRGGGRERTLPEKNGGEPGPRGGASRAHCW